QRRSAVLAEKPSPMLFYDFPTGVQLCQCDALQDGMGARVFSSDGRMLACSGDFNDFTLHGIEVFTGRERFRLSGHGGRGSCLTFAADNQKLVSGSVDTTALVWDLTGRLAAQGKWDAALTAAELDTLWSDLASDDAARAWKALQRLAAAPAQSVPHVARHV